MAPRHALLIFLAVIENIRILAGRESNMTGGKEEGPIDFAAKVETASSFEVGGSLQSNLKTECRSEWDTYVDCRVNEGDVVKELGSGPWLFDERNVNRLTKSDLNVGIPYSRRISLQRVAGASVRSKASHVHSRKKRTRFQLQQSIRGRYSSI